MINELFGFYDKETDGIRVAQNQVNPIASNDCEWSQISDMIIRECIITLVDGVRSTAHKRAGIGYFYPPPFEFNYHNYNKFI